MEKLVWKTKEETETGVRLTVHRSGVGEDGNAWVGGDSHDPEEKSTLRGQE